MSSPGPEVDDEEAPLLHYGRTPATATPLSTASQKNGGALKTRLAGIFSLAVPLVTQNIFGYSLSIISAIAVGWLNDPNVLSAVVLAGSVYNVTGYSLVVGLSAGCDAISAQAFGAGNYLLLGVVLQRAILICWAVSLPVLVLWCHAGSLLAALHQAPEISAGAARYLLLASPSLFITAVSGNIQRYLLAQQVVQPSTICTAITALLCPLYNWLLIYKLRLGLDGAAAAFLASNLTYTCLMLGYKAWREAALRHSPLRTWSGWSLRGAFQGWGQYLQYGLPAAAMICCEWWVFEAVILMSGALPNADVAVAVMGISFHMTACAYMLPMGVGTAVSTFIGTELGAGDSRGARSIFNIGLSTVCCTQLLLGGGLYLGRAHLPRVFTGAPEVVRLVTHTMPAVSAAVVGDGLNALLSGVLRGSGRQAWGAALNLVGYWGLGFPLAYYLGFTRHLDTLGFWSALALASAVQAGIQVVVVVCLDWELEARRARTRVEAHGPGTADPPLVQAPSLSLSLSLSEPLLLSGIVCGRGSLERSPARAL